MDTITTREKKSELYEIKKKEIKGPKNLIFFRHNYLIVDQNQKKNILIIF